MFRRRHNYYKLNEEFPLSETKSQTGTGKPVGVETETAGGYTFEFVEIPCTMFLCNTCHYVSREPRLSLCCGSTYCKSCLAPTPSACPTCQDEQFATVANKQIDRAVQSLLVFCANKKEGCVWKGRLCDIGIHLQDTCQLKKVSKAVMKEKLVPCEEMLSCPNNCGVQNMHTNISDHKMVCPLEIIQCEFHIIGCKSRILRKDQNSHNITLVNDHLLLTKHTLKLAQENTTPKKHIGIDTETELVCCERRLQAAVELLIEKVEQVDVDIKAQSDEVQAFQKLLGKFEQLDKNIKARSQAFQNRVDSLLKEKLQEISGMLLWNNVRSERINVLPVKGQLELVAPVIVRMSGFELKKSNKTQWYSNPFFSYNKRYKMVLRVVAAGSNIGAGTHLSVYFHLMKGPYDDQIAWPCNETFELFIINRRGAGKSLKSFISFKDVPTASGRVQNGIATVGAGKPQYISHEKLYDTSFTFIKDDCIVFKVQRTSA